MGARQILHIRGSKAEVATVSKLEKRPENLPGSSYHTGCAKGRGAIGSRGRIVHDNWRGCGGDTGGRCRRNHG